MTCEVPGRCGAMPGTVREGAVSAIPSTVKYAERLFIITSAKFAHFYKFNKYNK